MELGMKFVFFSIILITLLSEAELNPSKRSIFFNKINKSLTNFLLNFLFPKEPGILRVKNSEEARAVNKVTTLDFMGLVERHGYPSEEHYVTTEDGYNLKIHRIPDSPLSNNKQPKIVMLFIHGILSSSDSWVLFGPKKDLAFLLADQGYDIWFGNYRGNSYCRSHVKMSPYDAKFWEYSYHDVGTKDLPATIDYVLNYTKSETLYYIGHSMGTTSFFVLLSTKPEYNAKIKLGTCLAPVAFWKETSPVFKFFFNLTPQIKEFLDNNNIYELFSLSSTSITAGRKLCADEAITQALCITIFSLIAGSDPAQFNTTVFPEILSYYPAGTSLKSFVHYYQNGITGNFQTFDYGNLGNYERYKQLTPVKYNVKKITAPIAMFYGDNDPITLKSNVLQLYKQLPNVILLEEIPYRLFTHMDFLWSIDGKALLYDRVIEVMQEFESGSNTSFR
ncbi:lipase 3-like [Camponotus floridanus]|nr:lipase 3-like [Camponotus floridanus]XP_025261730.1 lipase 3-like [Camponotus floridanus]